KAQSEERWPRAWGVLGTLAAFVALVGTSALRYFFVKWDYSLVTVAAAGGQAFKAITEAADRVVGREGAGYLLGALLFVLYVVYIFLPVVAGGMYAAMPRPPRSRPPPHSAPGTRRAGQAHRA